MMKDNYKIYVHINKSNGKMYIGQTIYEDPNIRWKNGYGYKGNQYFWNSIQKYGWDNFEHIVLIENLSLEEANLIEEELISKYNTTNKNIGYNLRPGGKNSKNTIETNKKISNAKLGHSVSKETRKRISKNHADCKGENNPRYGKHCTEETKNKIREKISGKKHPFYGKQRSEQTKEKIRKNHKNVVGENNPMYGRKQTDIAKEKVAESKRGKPRSEETKRKLSEYHTGLKLSNETKQKLSEIRSKKVKQYSLEYIYINTYYGTREAERITGINHCGISACCNGKQKTAGGFIWEYEN